MSSETIGSFTFVLHAHLPYVLAHGRWPHGMDWLTEAAAETYIPLLDALNELIEAGHSPRITLGLTPVLCEQLADEDFKAEFGDYLTQKIAAAEEDYKTFDQWNREHLSRLALWWRDHYRHIKERFENRYDREIIGAFRRLQDEGYLEIITCAATHGYLPLLGLDDNVRAQVRVGTQSYRHHFGRQPRGIWLPECAYRPAYAWSPPVETPALPKRAQRLGVEQILAENDLEYFLIDSALLKGGKTVGVYIERFEALRRLWRQFESQYQERPEDKQKTPRQAYLVGNPMEGKKPVAAFVRDPHTGVQVWSGEHGYPGDGWYLDFHKKHFPGGHRYWRVTSSKSDLAEKQEYEPDRAAERIPENAKHFVGLVKKILKEYYDQTGKKGILCAPFDAELFGHWWFEGPRWLGRVLEKLEESDVVVPYSCSAFLETAKPLTVVSLPEGSWGEGGFHYIWLNDWTKWTWRHVYEAEDKMCEVARKLHDRGSENAHRVACQMGRELLILESSDWQFLISTWSARDYAEARVARHWENFQRLHAIFGRLEAGDSADEADWRFLQICEENNKIFQDIKPSLWLP
ncbi:DUF1957 domain-containing protein [bacterium]|nr:DUF1957 domain-containing protein [bacterium]